MECFPLDYLLIVKNNMLVCLGFKVYNHFLHLNFLEDHFLEFYLAVRV